MGQVFLGSARCPGSVVQPGAQGGGVPAFQLVETSLSQGHQAERRTRGRWLAQRPERLAPQAAELAVVEARLDEVTAPVLVVMGERDPDFKDAAAEARWIAGRLHGDLLLVPGAGHYPHVEDPQLVNPAIVEFTGRVTSRA